MKTLTYPEVSWLGMTESEFEERKWVIEYQQDGLDRHPELNEIIFKWMQIGGRKTAIRKRLKAIREQNLAKLAILGPPYSGKNTIAGFLYLVFGWEMIDVGQWLRTEHMKDPTKFQKSFTGSLEDSEPVIDYLLHMNAKRPSFVIAGSPRMVNEAKTLWSRGLKLDRVLVLNARDEELYKRRENRIARDKNKGRKIRGDDLPGKAEKRIRDFQVKTLGEVVPFYAAKRIVRLVDANGEIYETLLNALEVLSK